MDPLEMPDALAGRGIERYQRIGKKIIADAIATVKVIGPRNRSGTLDNAALLVDGHAGPVISGAGIFPCVCRPGVIAEFSRPRAMVW